mmetsp:Transcript_34392/g.67994  ORF Transcript_34392/g.67994 Transcript_34392/m.67994 type:complete len:520 (-) Transcript_34392:68-1627(-)
MAGLRLSFTLWFYLLMSLCALPVCWGCVRLTSRTSFLQHQGRFCALQPRSRLVLLAKSWETASKETETATQGQENRPARKLPLRLIAVYIPLFPTLLALVAWRLFPLFSNWAFRFTCSGPTEESTKLFGNAFSTVFLPASGMALGTLSGTTVAALHGRLLELRKLYQEEVTRLESTGTSLRLLFRGDKNGLKRSYRALFRFTFASERRDQGTLRQIDAPLPWVEGISLFRRGREGIRNATHNSGLRSDDQGHSTRPAAELSHEGREENGRSDFSVRRPDSGEADEPLRGVEEETGEQRGALAVSLGTVQRDRERSREEKKGKPAKDVTGVEAVLRDFEEALSLDSPSGEENQEGDFSGSAAEVDAEAFGALRALMQVAEEAVEDPEKERDLALIAMVWPNESCEAALTLDSPENTVALRELYGRKTSMLLAAFPPAHYLMLSGLAVLQLTAHVFDSLNTRGDGGNFTLARLAFALTSGAFCWMAALLADLRDPSRGSFAVSDGPVRECLGRIHDAMMAA